MLRKRITTLLRQERKYRSNSWHPELFWNLDSTSGCPYNQTMGRCCLILVIVILCLNAQEIDSLQEPSSREQDARHRTVFSSKAVHDKWFSEDKFLHFSASAAISGFTYHMSLRHLDASEHRGRVYSISLTALLGIAKEFYDKKKDGHFSWKDLFWDGVGLGVGYLVFVRPNQ